MSALVMKKGREKITNTTTKVIVTGWSKKRFIETPY
jgi:hypothetical protein